MGIGGRNWGNRDEKLQERAVEGGDYRNWEDSLQEQEEETARTGGRRNKRYWGKGVRKCRNLVGRQLGGELAVTGRKNCRN